LEPATKDLIEWLFIPTPGKDPEEARPCLDEAQALFARWRNGHEFFM